MLQEIVGEAKNEEVRDNSACYSPSALISVKSISSQRTFESLELLGLQFPRSDCVSLVISV